MWNLRRFPFKKTSSISARRRRSWDDPCPPVRSYELPVPDLSNSTFEPENDLVYLAQVWELGRKTVTDAEGRRHYVDGTMKTRRDLARLVFPDLGRVRACIEEVLDGI